MRAWIVFAVFAFHVGCSRGLRCMTCYGSSSIDECDAAGHVQQCMPNEKSCETVVRRYGDHMVIIKGCKDTGACRDNQRQNKRFSGSSTQCNLDQPNSLCSCCCDDDLCNVGNPRCTPHYTPPTPADDCPQVSPSFPHGSVECRNGNNTGSVCQYQCTEKDYSVWPEARRTAVCLNNGSWSRQRPCCARPCPPYYLLDDVFIYHFAGDDAEELLAAQIELMLYPVIAEDAVKAAALYYSEEVIESSVIKFNEYNADTRRFYELSKERLSIQNEGRVNTGAAIRYALDHLFTAEAGMRKDGVPKAFWAIFGNANPEGDFQGPAEEARRNGILIYVVGHETGGFRFDRRKMVELAGEEAHVFITDKAPGETAALSDEVNSHFCQDPCEHVLHDHD